MMNYPLIGIPFSIKKAHSRKVLEFLVLLKYIYKEIQLIGYKK